MEAAVRGILSAASATMTKMVAETCTRLCEPSGGHTGVDASTVRDLRVHTSRAPPPRLSVSSARPLRRQKTRGQARRRPASAPRLRRGGGFQVPSHAAARPGQRARRSAAASAPGLAVATLFGSPRSCGSDDSRFGFTTSPSVAMRRWQNTFRAPTPTSARRIGRRPSWRIKALDASYSQLFHVRQGIQALHDDTYGGNVASRTPHLTARMQKRAQRTPDSEKGVGARSPRLQLAVSGGVMSPRTASLASPPAFPPLADAQ